MTGGRHLACRRFFRTHEAVRATRVVIPPRRGGAGTLALWHIGQAFRDMGSPT